MIVARLMGGLGNQMFQYAMARSLAIKYRADLALDLSWFEEIHPGVTPRKFALTHFNLEARRATNLEVADLSGRCQLKKHRARLFSNRWQGIRKRKMTCSQKNQIDRYAEALKNHEDVYLEGYWQSERYFAEFTTTIRRELMPPEPVTAPDIAMAEKILSRNAVAVHFRRGDYVEDETTAAVHGVPPLGYYSRALEEVKKKVTDLHLFIFSDDPQWVCENVSFPVPMEVVGHTPPEHAERDLRLMSLCKHAIIANSSFSWWGAWLIDNPDKIVIAPQHWFADPARHSPDLIPACWLQVANE